MIDNQTVEFSDGKEKTEKIQNLQVKTTPMAHLQPSFHMFS